MAPDPGPGTGPGGGLRLYSARACPFAQRTRMVLHLKGVEHELTEIDLRETPAWFQALSPYGKVPLLVQGEHRIWESAVINEYLEERFPEPPLLPAEPERRALARIWVDFANTRFLPLFYKLLLEQDEARQAGLATRLAETLQFMETEGLGGPGAGDYWLGETPGLADIAFYPFLERFPVLAHYRDFHVPDACTALRRWHDRMSALECARSTGNGPEFYVRAYASYADGRADGSTAREMREA